ncbi:HD family hydrolase [Buttiauxella sp. B2]|uniref:HD family hydrolase n=1 Tax=Buttiauxella sp. B2 TaxID=2587812 RepID=UPI00111F628A|nr:HD family hydrolase [Buttiauxella sp. B2]TNV14937.1 HD family hydrolase [Buttiauxella sp. B2]
MSWIRTYTGKHFDYRNVRHEDICIEDIANALSNICRFAGHLPEFYSVAQHSVLASRLVRPEFALEALLHDAAEAYCQDIPSPLKALLPDYQIIEEYVDSAIRNKFELPAAASSCVKYADLVMLATERQELELDDGTPWPILEGIPPTDLFPINPLRPGQAYALFMARFEELTGVTCNA